MPKVLIVDDEPGVSAAFSCFLAADGHTVRTATNADEALRLVKAEAPDIVLLDIRMPGTDGMTLLQEVRTISPGTKVMMVSAYLNRAIRDRTARLGAPCVQKPVNLFTLRHSVNNLLASSTA